MLYRELITKLRAYMLAFSGHPSFEVIPADDPGPSPPLPFATLRLINSNVEVTKGYSQAKHGEPERACLYLRMLAQVDVYGEAGFDILANINAGTYTEEGSYMLYSNGVSFDVSGGVNDLSQLLDDRREKRYQQDFTVRYMHVFDSPIQPIEAQSIDLGGNMWQSRIDVALPATTDLTVGSLVSVGQHVSIETDLTL